MSEKASYARCLCAAGGPFGEDIDVNPDCPRHGDEEACYSLAMFGECHNGEPGCEACPLRNDHPDASEEER